MDCGLYCVMCWEVIDFFCFLVCALFRDVSMVFARCLLLVLWSMGYGVSCLVYVPAYVLLLHISRCDRSFSEVRGSCVEVCFFPTSKFGLLYFGVCSRSLSLICVRSLSLLLVGSCGACSLRFFFFFSFFVVGLRPPLSVFFFLLWFLCGVLVVDTCFDCCL